MSYRELIIRKTVKLLKRLFFLNPPQSDLPNMAGQGGELLVALQADGECVLSTGP
jgi:hypothetical protein